jgi:hypothetical protein
VGCCLAGAYAGIGGGESAWGRKWDVEQASARFEAVRTRGFPYLDGEMLAGVRAIGAPVFNAAGDLATVLTVLGVGKNFSGGERGALAATLVDAARSFSQRLRGPQPLGRSVVSISAMQASRERLIRRSCLTLSADKITVHVIDGHGLSVLGCPPIPAAPYRLDCASLARRPYACSSGPLGISEVCNSSFPGPDRMATY